MVLLWLFPFLGEEHILTPGATPKKIGSFCAARFPKPYPIDDQNLGFPQPYLRLDQNFNTLLMAWPLNSFRSIYCFRPTYFRPVVF